MTNRKVIDEIRVDRPLSEVEAGQAIDTVFGAIERVLARGEPVTIKGFGTFKRDFRDTRQARNPRTGETVTTIGRHVVKFKEPRRR